MTLIGTDINRAAQLLERGALVAIPTETVYGLAGNGTNPEVVSRIFEVKNRPVFDPMILHFKSKEDARPFVKDIPKVGLELTNEFWPGPLTLLLEKMDLVPDLVTAGSHKVAVRVPSHPMLQELLGRLPFPLAAPSANPFGYISPTTAEHVADQLGGRISYILDGGPCNIGLESTIVDVTQGTPRVLRKGGITIEEVERVMGKVLVEEHSTSRPTAPGMLASHYAPKTEFTLLNEDTIKDVDLSRVGLLAFRKVHDRVPRENQIVLSNDGDLGVAAQNLFAAMRTLDNMNFTRIYAELVPEKGLGRAINDKLRRASA